MQDIWGPWILHDGKGCPLPPGTIVEVVFEDRFGYQNRTIGCVDGDSHSSWDWSFYPELKKIVRYRDKKPKGLEMLREIAESLDFPSTPNKVGDKEKGRPVAGPPLPVSLSSLRLRSAGRG